MSELYQMKKSDIPRIRDELVKKQNYKCLICGRDFRDLPKRDCCLDHNHYTWRVRGSICRECNSLEGKFYRAFVRVGARNKGIDYRKLLVGLADYFVIKETNYVYPVKPKRRKKIKVKRNKK